MNPCFTLIYGCLIAILSNIQFSPISCYSYCSLWRIPGYLFSVPFNLPSFLSSRNYSHTTSFQKVQTTALSVFTRSAAQNSAMPIHSVLGQSWNRSKKSIPLCKPLNNIGACHCSIHQQQSVSIRASKLIMLLHSHICVFLPLFHFVAPLALPFLWANTLKNTKAPSFEWEGTFVWTHILFILWHCVRCCFE
jgi:hypothetical protein